MLEKEDELEVQEEEEEGEEEQEKICPILAFHPEEPQVKGWCVAFYAYTGSFPK